jgi:hypothetical protein
MLLYIYKAIIMPFCGQWRNRSLKKVSQLSLTAIILVLLALVLTCVFVPTNEISASASTDWSLRVCKVTSDGDDTVYTDLSSGECLTESVTLAFLILDSINNTSYKYLESDYAISDFSNILDTEWQDMNDLDSIEYPDSAGTTQTYLKYTYEPLSYSSSKCDKYVYVRRSDGTTYTYSRSWNIKINLSVSAEDLGIDDIYATYQNSSGSVVEYTGAWTSKSITFTITTQWMNNEDPAAEYNSSDEVLFYSIDGKLPENEEKEWIAMNTNVITLASSLSQYIYFKVTNISQTDSSVAKFQYQVNIDMEKPTFNLSAVTTDLNGDEEPYSSTSWACNSVYFTITADNDCLSSITYYYRTNLQPTYVVYSSSVYPCLESLSVLQFKATNEAGMTAYSDEYEVNIDDVQPVVSVTVLTEDPDDSNSIITLEQNEDTYYYANGKIYFNVYNISEDSSSPLSYTYAVKNNDTDTYSSFKELTFSFEDENGDAYYYYSDTIDVGTILSRSYIFRIESGAGIVSEDFYLNAILVNDDFTIEVEEITYSANSKGWASSAIPVYMKVYPDSTASSDSDYIIPEYTFYYSPVEISNVLYSAKGELYSNDEEEGYSIYKFNLSASANSAFTIYATNMAGKASNIVQTDDKIMIDTELPVVQTENYLLSAEDGECTNIEIESGDWVDGSIYFTLKVEIGISSIYVYSLKYVTDEDGNPTRDSNGDIIWIENSSVEPQSECVDGVAYYHYTFRLDDSTIYMKTEYYGYRVYTGSGIYVDEEFVANFDSSDISLDSIAVLDEDSYDTSVSTISVVDDNITLDPVGEDFYIKLFSNSEQAGHYDYMWLVDGSYVDVEEYDEYIVVSVPENQAGTLELQFYLISDSVTYQLNDNGDYEEYFKKSKSYTILAEYNTLNITINYSATTSDTSESEWKTGNIEVSISLQTSDEGGENKELDSDDKSDYFYYYMLIDYDTFTTENSALLTGEWILCTTENNGSYDTENQYNFSIYFTDSSFCGYLALSVSWNKVYRSSSSGFVTNKFSIDNTTPEIETMVSQSIGDDVDDSDLKIHTYYSNTDIYLENISSADRSEITCYYYIIPTTGDVPDGNPSTSDTNGWSVLTSTISFEAGDDDYTPYSLILYAVNELGAYSGGIIEGSYYTYEFIIDTSILTGELSYSPYDGGYLNSATGLWSYQWQEEATISLSSENSNTSVSFWYSIDEGEYIPYDSYYYNAGTTESIIFDSVIFPDGVMGTFAFKVVNMAGSEYVYREKIYIAMDFIAPDFEISLTVNGATYDGGQTQFSDTTGDWSYVDVTININSILDNVSGAIYTYKIYYYDDNTMKIAVEEQSIPNTTSFSSYTILSDSVLFPNRSGDIILEITATNKKNSEKYTSHSVRIRIDKTIPTFELTGLASSSDSTLGTYINSGEWTNNTQVIVSKSNIADNASDVTYIVTYEDLTSTSKEQYEWTTGNSLQAYTQTCTITVNAYSEAGLEYTAVFQVNIDTIDPIITFMGGLNVIEGEDHYIDIKVVVLEENIKKCQYITVIGEDSGFPLDPTGYIISTSSVDNSTRYDTSIDTDDIEDSEYSGYVKIYVEDYAGNIVTFEFYMLPFALTVNNITLSDEDARTLEKYEEDLDLASVYMESSRITYFDNLIQRLKDRISTLNEEIDGYRAYLEKLAQRISYELKSDYYEMYDYLEVYNDYAVYGQEWIQEAIKGDASSKYYTYYENLITVFSTLQAEMDKVTAVEDDVKTLPAINVVEADDYNDVLRVYDEYNDLTVDQKACVTTTLYTKLLALKKACEILLLTDEDSGISIDGDFTPGATIEITEYTESTEYYINAQAAILSVIDSSDPQAIVSINRISLTGSTSQTTTGDITITLPIPEEWQDYITFAVYKVTSDGSVSIINDVEIAGDGESVTFVSDELSTFVLCAKANIQGTDVDDSVYGTLLGLDLDVTMIRNLGIVGAVLFALIIIIVIITGARHKKFLSNYNKAYKSSRYRKGIQEIPYGNTMPKGNPLKPDERVKVPKHPY